VFSAFPDTGLDNFWWAPSIQNIATFPDVEGGLDMSSVGNPTLGSINGVQAALYDGDDHHEVNTAPSFGPSNTYTLATVFDLTTSDAVFSVGDGRNNGVVLRFFDDYRITHPGTGTEFEAGSFSTNPTVLVATYDGSAVTVDVNGSQVGSQSLADPISPTQTTFIGFRGDFGQFADGDIGAVGWEASSADSARRDELTNILGDEFGITVST